MIEHPTALTGKRGGVLYLVCRDPSNPEAWRCSRFDSAGPVGHSNATTFVEAVMAALDHGADLATVQYVTPSTVDAVALAAGVDMVLRDE
jgi:hypothetical protein